MILRFRTLFTAISLVAVLASGAQAGPIRDLLKNLREERKGGATTATDAELRPITVSFQGTNRTFFVYVPQSVAGRSNVPAVVVFHGGGGDISGLAAASEMTIAADAFGFVAIFPSVVSGQWNDGRSGTASGYDDVGFVRAIVGNSSSLFGVDLGRIFAAGISNGGMFTQRLSCDAADLISAAAIVSANMPADYQSQCRPSQSVPKVFFNGTSDPIMPWSGGEVKSLAALGLGAGGQVLSHDQTKDFWLAMDGCNNSASTRNRPDVSNDGTTVTQSTYASCRGSSQLEFFDIKGGGHSWPGSSVRARRVAGKVSQDISATAEMIAFFQKYGL
jgi:polyhydroxybutyrate depolymerase